VNVSPWKRINTCPTERSAPVRLRAARLGLLCALLVPACHDHGTEPVRPTALVFIVQPSNTTAGAVFSPAIQVAARDAADTTLTSFSGSVTIAIGTSAAGGTLSGTKTVTASDGIATFSDLRIDAVGNGYTLTASAVGVTATSVAFNSVAVCHTNNCWTTKAAMPTVRTSFGVGAANGLVYTVGGSITKPAVGTVEAYDPITNTWSSKAPMPTGRSGAGVGVVNGILYAVGGIPAGAVDPVPTGSVEAYDPATNTWTARRPITKPRLGMIVGVVNGILYAVGGSVPATSTPVASAEVDAYDPVSNTWTTKAPMPTPRIGFRVGVVNGLLYTVGGDATGTVEAYDPATNTWTPRQPMLTVRQGFGVGVVDGILYTVGGSTGDDGSVPPTTSIVDIVEAYDPVANTWTTRAPMPTGRRFLGIGVLNGVLYAIGGRAKIPGGDTGVNEAYQP
jgi:N-acetylneuraminic acid mutarotase